MPQMIPPQNRPDATYGTVTVDPVTGVMVIETDAEALRAEGWKLVDAPPTDAEKPQEKEREE